MKNLRTVLEASVPWLRVAGIVAILVLAALVVWERTSHDEHGVPTVTEKEIDIYLDVALDVRRGRKAASKAGWHPTMWYRWPQVRDALDRAGWEMSEYVRIESLIATAFLAVDSPKQFAADYPPGSAPQATRAAVQARLADVRAAQAPLQD